MRLNSSNKMYNLLKNKKARKLTSMTLAIHRKREKKLGLRMISRAIIREKKKNHKRMKYAKLAYRI